MADPSTKVIESMTDEELRQEIETLAPMIGNERVFQRRWTMLQELGSRARLGQGQQPQTEWQE